LGSDAIQRQTPAMDGPIDPSPGICVLGKKREEWGEYGAGCAVSELGLLVSQCPQNSWKPHPSTCRSIANRTSDSLHMRFPLLSQREMLPRLGWRTSNIDGGISLVQLPDQRDGERVGTETTAFSEKHLCSMLSAPRSRLGVEFWWHPAKQPVTETRSSTPRCHVCIDDVREERVSRPPPARGGAALL